MIGVQSQPSSPVLHVDSLGRLLAGIVFAGLGLEALGLYAHHRDLNKAGNEGAASLYLQRTRFGYPMLVRYVLLVFSLFATAVLAQVGLQELSGKIIAGLLLASLLGSQVIGRSLFYAVVIPTTMPGAFFWKNQGFVEHARESGLADMQQLGVAYEHHHAFDWRALLDTLKESAGRSGQVR